MARVHHGIEALRILGAVAIVWFHLGLPGDWAAMAALHVFVILAVHFGTSRPATQHARRLMIPWLFWSAVYGAAKVTQALLHGQPPAGEFAPWMLLTGLSVHLWFLPFCFAALLFATRTHPLPVWAPPALLALVLALRPFAGALPVPLAQWAHVLPAAALGLWMARREDPRLPLGATAALTTALWLSGYGKGIEQTAIAAWVCLAAFVVPLPASAALSVLAGASFGVYLVHPLIVALLLEAGLTGAFALFALALGLSLLVSLALKRVLPFAL